MLNHGNWSPVNYLKYLNDYTPVVQAYHMGNYIAYSKCAMKYAILEVTEKKGSQTKLQCLNHMVY